MKVILLVIAFSLIPLVAIAQNKGTVASSAELPPTPICYLFNENSNHLCFLVTFFLIFVTMESVQNHIEHSIIKRKKGDLVFPTDFRGKGTATAIKMALSRLAKEGRLKRLAHGIYYVPKTDPLFGELYPAPEQVAETVAKKEKVRIKPSGAYALHKLGLTTQVPTKLVYITDGEQRQIKMGKTLIRFKPTTPKKMALEGPLSSLVIQALEELDIAKIDQLTRDKLKSLLRKEDPKLLKKDLSLAPAHIHDYILGLLNESL